LHNCVGILYEIILFGGNLQIPIVLAINSAYTKQATVVMYSALKNAKQSTKYSFFVITHDLKDSDIKFIDSVLRSHTNLTDLQIIFVSDSDYNSIPLIGRFGREAFFRLFIPKLLPNLDKLIYLDSDTMVLSDLTQLFDTNVDGKAYAACSEKRLYSYKWNVLVCRDMQSRFEFFDKIGFDILDNQTHYTNSGVMIINNKYWIQHNWLDRAMNFVAQNIGDINFSCPDQDALNILAWQDGVDSRVYLDWKYNVSNNFVLDKCDKQNLVLQANFRSLYYDGNSGKDFEPAIIHYAGGIKPWNGGTELLSAKYREYAKEIGWNIKTNTINVFRWILNFLIKFILFFVPYGLVKFFFKFKVKIKLFLKALLPKFMIRFIKKFI